MRALLALALMTTAAHAAVICKPTLEEFSTVLERKFGELPQAIGRKSDGQSLFLFLNPETHTWTIVAQTVEGPFCMPAFGTDYRAAPVGEPA